MTVLFLCSEIRDNGLIGALFDCVESAAWGLDPLEVGKEARLGMKRKKVESLRNR